MNRALLLLLTTFLITNSGLTVLPVTQNDQGTPVTVTPMGPKFPGLRVPFRTSCGLEDQLRLVVRDRAAWEDIWKRIHSIGPSHLPDPATPALPEIDFSREMVIVAAMGQRPTSGYGIIIDRAYAYERNYRLEVLVRNVENRKCGGLTVVTSPVDIVRLPKTDRSVVFREIEVELDCKTGTG